MFDKNRKKLYNIVFLEGGIILLKRETIIWDLILNGYNDLIVDQLPKLFIEDFFNKEQEKLSEDLDIFIDEIQKGSGLPDENGNVIFGVIQRIEGNDMKQKSLESIFSQFQYHITNEFMRIVRRQPLQKILIDGGFMKPVSKVGDHRPSFAFNKGFIENSKEYCDLCIVKSYVSLNCLYIKTRDLYSLLQSKGISKESVSICHMISSSVDNLNEGFCIKYRDIMKLGTENFSSIPYTLKK